MLLATAAMMRNLDARALSERGIPGGVLMENAGRQTVEAMERHFGSLLGKPVVIVVGPGNNGGDGFVVARLLHQREALPRVLLVADPETIRGDAAVNLDALRRLPVPLARIASPLDLAVHEPELRQAFLVVDALFGTGLGRPVEGVCAEVVAAINRAGRPVVSVDLPSGLDSDTGQPLGACVRADLTVTFALAKQGQMIPPGVDLTGRLEVVDIGIPPDLVEVEGPMSELLQADTVAAFLPGRPRAAHKGTYGHLVVLAGSHGKAGAAILAARGALRAGTGLVTVGVPHRLHDALAAGLPEAMTAPLASDWNLTEEDLPAIQQALAGKKAVVLGPGIGTGEETGRLVARLYQDTPLPLVADADALNLLAPSAGTIPAAGPRVLTPHPGEMARLAGLSTSQVQSDRIGVARALAVRCRAVVVLKGAGTVVAAPDRRVAVNPTGNPGMATAGMGDVLAGVVGGFLAQGLDPWRAACLGVFAHGRAADRVADNNAVAFGFLASEVANELPLALHELVASRRKDP